MQMVCGEAQAGAAAEEIAARRSSAAPAMFLSPRPSKMVRQRLESRSEALSVKVSAISEDER